MSRALWMAQSINACVEPVFVSGRSAAVEWRGEARRGEGEVWWAMEEAMGGLYARALVERQDEGLTARFYAGGGVRAREAGGCWGEQRYRLGWEARR